jgi:hypothetical protein
MQGDAWIALLKRIPAAQHNILTVRTSCGTEVNVQNILRLDAEYVVIRGRLAATTETGRVYFVPYDQINYIGYMKEVKVEQIQELFEEPLLGEPGKTAADAAVAENGDAKPEEGSEIESSSSPEVESSSDKPETLTDDGAKPPDRFSGKEAILQRLRARTLATRKP